MTPVNGLIFFEADNKELFVYDHLLSSTSKVELTQAKIYPSIKQDMINIASEKAFSIIEIIDIQGLVVNTIQVNAFTSEVDVSGLIPSNFIIRLSDEKGVFKTIKFIKI